MLERIIAKINITELAVIIFVGVALYGSITQGNADITTILGSGLLGYLGGSKGR